MSIKKIKEKYNPFLVDYVSNLDWTFTKKYTQKICEFIVNQNIINLPIDDVKTHVNIIVNTVKLFDRYSTNFVKKDIMQYLTLDELSLTINNYISHFNSNKMRNMDKVNSKDIDGIYLGTYNDYDVIKIETYKHAVKYSGYCSWCITKQEYTFNEYTRNHEQFYFLLKNEYKPVVAVSSRLSPDDDYGLSMLAVCVTNTGDVSVTTRWNMLYEKQSKLSNSWKELSILLGVEDIKKLLIPYSVDQFLENRTDSFKIINLKLDMGINYHKIFKTTYKTCNGFSIVEYDKLENFINSNNKLLSPEWFDIVYDFKKINDNFYAIVYNDSNANVINSNGEKISKVDYRDVFYLNGNLYFVIKIGTPNKGFLYNTMDCNGNILNNEWFNKYEQNKPFSRVTINNGTQYLDKFGKLLIKNKNDDVV